MKKVYLLTFLSLLYSVSLKAIDYSYLDQFQRQSSRDEVEQRLKFMMNHPSLLDFLTFYNDRLEVYKDQSWTELDYVYYYRLENEPPIALPSHSMKGLKVAIDPGHIGGNFAVIEERYIEMLYDPSITFAEGDLWPSTRPWI